MNHKSMLTLVFAFMLATPWTGFADERPNVVVILVDDMGFSDLGCYGSEIETPNLDSLAAGGLRFTQFYNTGRCCPTRATLLTGLYAHQAGVGHMNERTAHPGYQGYLNDRCVTLGDVARSAGYMTMLTGKWHVGAKQKSMWPLARGFDRFYGVPEGGGFYFQVKEGRSVVRNTDVVADLEHPLADGWYSTDAWTDEGLKFVDEAVDAKQPFLWYLAHNAPHFPLQASAEDISKFRGRYRQGWDQLSDARHQRQIELGIVDASWAKSPREQAVAAWASLSDKDQDRFDHMMATYAACVHAMDRSVGTLVKGLRSRGLLQNTLILFMSDNGGCAESGPDGRSKGDPTTADSNWFCGESWAWLQDTPFRKYKHYNHEGGIASPLIAHWPNGIVETGRLRSEPSHLIDIMATVVDVTGGEYPAVKAGKDIEAMQGTSLAPLLRESGDGSLNREALFWEHEGNAAVRTGEWKLVRLGANGLWELYNMQADRTEQKNLADIHPDRVEAMSKQWLDWAERCNVSTTGVPKAKKKAAAE